MKKILTLLVLLITITISGHGQYTSLSVSYTPADHGLGLKGLHLKPSIGVYGSVSYGNAGSYKLMGFKNHYKFSTGVTIPFIQDHNKETAITAGVNYHIVTIEGYSPFHRGPLSAEIGIHTRMNNMTFGFRTDILRWEPCIDIGYIIRKHKN